MQVERIKPQDVFKPVCITLETQEELDTFYAFANHAVISREFPVMDSLWNQLKEVGCHSSPHHHNRLCGLID